jgi:hypothetical protein
MRDLNLEMLIFTEGEKPGNPEKNPRGKGENQQTTILTYDAESGNRTWATVVRGEPYKMSYRIVCHSYHQSS